MVKQNKRYLKIGFSLENFDTSDVVAFLDQIGNLILALDNEKNTKGLKMEVTKLKMYDTSFR